MKKIFGLAIVLSMLIFAVNTSEASGISGADAVRETANLAKILESIKYNNTLDKNIVTIVSGLSSTYEPTFDTYRIVSGEAKEGTYVCVYKYNKINNKPNLKEVTVHKIGELGMFSEFVQLEIGKNYVAIKGQYNDKVTAKEYCVNRKNADIKQKLKSMSMMFNYNKIDLGFLR